MTKTIKKISIGFRPYAVTDIPFITSSWLYGWSNAPANFGVHKHVYFKTTEVYIQETIKRAGVIICCDPNDPNEIFGFICAEYMDDETVMHWLHVKSAFRGYGIGKAMFNRVHKSEAPPFTTAYCPWYSSVNNLFNKGKSEEEVSALYKQSRNELNRPAKIDLIDGAGRNIGSINKNSMVYAVEKPGMKRSKYPVIYSPLLIARLNDCNTRPIAKLVE